MCSAVLTCLFVVLHSSTRHVSLKWSTVPHASTLCFTVPYVSVMCSIVTPVYVLCFTVPRQSPCATRSTCLYDVFHSAHISLCCAPQFSLMWSTILCLCVVLHSSTLCVPQCSHVSVLCSTILHVSVIGSTGRHVVATVSKKIGYIKVRETFLCSGLRGR
jgi:hypothetical protein